jgi:hypothetical protein
MPESDVKANNMYSHIKFPDYEYRPYPRMLYSESGETTTVLTEAEEADWYEKEGKAMQSNTAPSAAAVASVSATLGKVSAGYTPKSKG